MTSHLGGTGLDRRLPGEVSVLFLKKSRAVAMKKEKGVLVLRW